MKNLAPITFKQWIIFSFIFSIVITTSYHFIHHDCPNYDHFTTNFNETLAKIHLDKVLVYGEKTAGSIALNKYTTNYVLDQLKQIKEEKSPKIDMNYELAKSSHSSYHIMGHLTSYDNLYNIVVTIGPQKKSENLRYLLVNCHTDTPPGSYGASDDFVACSVMLEMARVLSKGEYKLNYGLMLLFNGAEEALLPASHAFITQHPLRHKIMAFLNFEGAGAGGRSILFQSSPSRISNFLLESFSRTAWSPQANVFGEELFQSGLVPGETDFRIFTHFGNIPGLDFAHIDNGYAYHTYHDVPNRISQNCIKITGDNILHMVTDLLSAEGIEEIPKLPEFTREEKKSNKILASPSDFLRNLGSKIFYKKDLMHYFYFDVLSLFIFRAPLLYLLSFNIILAIFCVWHVLRKRSDSRVAKDIYSPTRRGLYRAIATQVILLLTSLVFSLGLAWFHVKLGLILSWYTRNSNLIFLYILPIAGYQVVYHLIAMKLKYSPQLKWKMDRKESVNFTNIYQDFNDASLIMLVVIQLLFTSLRLGSSHILTQWILIACLLPQILLYPFNASVFVRLLATLIPYGATDYIMRTSLLLKVFIPVAGRSGQILPGEFPIAVIFFIVMQPFILTLSPGLACTQGRTLAKIAKIIGIIYFTTVPILYTTHLGFPYSSISDKEGVLNGTSLTSQQRVVMFHMNKVLYEDWSKPHLSTYSDSSIVITSLDSNAFRYLNVSSRDGLLMAPSSNPKKKDFPGDSLTHHKCNLTQPYCGISYYYPFAFVFSENVQYDRVSPHNSKPDSGLRIIEKKVLEDKCTEGEQYCWLKVNVTMTVDNGPPHTHMYLRTDPLFVRIDSYSFSSDPISFIRMPKTGQNNTGEHHFIYHLNGEATANEKGPIEGSVSWTSWVVFKVRSGAQKESSWQHTFDVAISGQYFDHDLSNSGRSAELDQVIEDYVPDWFIITAYPTSYLMWKVSLVF